MRLNVARELIYPCVVALAGIAAHSNGVIEALGGIQIRASASAQLLTLTAYDLTIGLQYTIEAEVEEDGCVVVDAALLRDVLRLADKDYKILLETDLNDNQLKLDTGALYRLSFLAGSDFPMPEFIYPDESITLTGIPGLAARLVNLAAEESSESNLHGVKLDFSKEGLKAVCCDGGNRVAQVSLTGQNRAELDLLIPAKALRLLASLVKDKDVLYVGATGKSVTFYDGVMRFSVRLLGGSYLDTDRLLNYVQPQFIVELDKDSFCKALDLAVTIEGSNCVQIMLREDCLEVGCIAAAADCINSVPIKRGNGPAPGPFYYGKSLLQSVAPLKDPLVLAFSGTGHLLICDETTKLFQNPMRPPSQTELVAMADKAKKKTAPKKPRKKKTEVKEAA